MSYPYQLVNRRKSSRELAEETQAPQIVAFDTNEDAADDHLSVGDAVAELTGGYPYHYDCSRGVSEPLLQLSVDFDYEYVASTDASRRQDALYDIDALPAALPAMEWGLLWTMSYSLGLLGCQILKQIPGSNVRQLDPSDGLIVSLSSRPVDSLDVSVTSCQFLFDFPANHSCYPMRGIILARYIAGDHVNSSYILRDKLLEIIQSELNQQKTLTGGVMQTLYLGVRAEYAAANAGSKGEQASPSNAATFSAIAIGIVVVVVGLIVGSVVVIRGRRRSQAERKSLKVLDQRDVEAAATPSSLSFVKFDAENASQSDQSMVTVAAKSIGSSTTVQVANTQMKFDVQDSLSLISTESTDDSAGSDGAVRKLPVTPDRSDYTPTSKIVDPPTLLPPKGIDNLPPLPPTGPSSKPSPAMAAAISNSNTRRRRKKKKRKKARISRVSSRENVQGMETIAEAEEAADDDEGSEYSWSTSDTDGSRSRDPSPCRSDSTLEISAAPSSDSTLNDNASAVTAAARRPSAPEQKVINESTDLVAQWHDSSPIGCSRKPSTGHEC